MQSRDAAAVLDATKVVDAAAVVEAAAALVDAATGVDAVLLRLHACRFSPAGRQACRRAPCLVAYGFTYSARMSLPGPAANLQHWRASGQRFTIGLCGRGGVLCASALSVSLTCEHTQAHRYTRVEYNIDIGGEIIFKTASLDNT